MWARCLPIVSTQLRHPVAVAASVRTTGTRHERSGPSARTARTSRTIVSASGWSALLTTMMSGISITPGLERLDRVAGSRHQREHDRVRVVDDVDLALADAHGLEEDVVLAGRVHKERGLERGLGEAAERAAGRHRADEDALVEEVVGEPDAVAQHGAPA